MAADEFALGLLVSKAAREQGVEWVEVQKTLAVMATPEIDSWATGAKLLGIEVFS